MEIEGASAQAGGVEAPRTGVREAKGPWVLVGGGQRGSKNKAHGNSSPSPGPGACETQLEAAAKQRGPPWDAKKVARSPTLELPAAGWGRGREHQAPRWGLPVSKAPTPKSPPSSITCPREETRGRGRPPAPRFQSLARSHGMGEQATSRLRRDACSPSEGTGEARPLSLSPPEERPPTPSWPQLA